MVRHAFLVLELSASFFEGVIPSLSAPVTKGESRIDPPVSDEMKPLSKVLSRFDESSSPFHRSSRSHDRP